MSPGRVDPKLLLVLLSVAAVGWLIWSDLERTSPGPISRTHAAVAELRGSDGCEACHGTGADGMPNACKACHDEVAHDFEAVEGLHGLLDAKLAGDCGACHVEHHGLSFPLVTERSFELAGAQGPEDFDHAVLEFELVGRHAELGCAECHEHADDPLLVEGTHRFVGFTQDCASCHEDPHEGRMVRGCAECHGQERPFEEVASFEHETVSLEGAHAGLSCSECHPAEGIHSVIELGATSDVTERGCEDCHESEHSPDFLASAGGCATCHAASDGDFGGHAERMPIASHAASGFALEAPHADLECAACHARAPASFEERFPGRSADACAVCHEDPHAGEFAPRACLECHARDAFRPSLFDVRDHDQTAFPLLDSHRDADCVACHERAQDDAPAEFWNTPTDCAACHADAHIGKLVASEAIPDPRDCSVCHRPTHFADVLGGPDAPLDREGGRDDRLPFLHDRDTAFALRGEHRDAACSACHPEHLRANEAGRRFGFAQRLGNAQALPPAARPVERDFTNCASCHIDPHWGVFDAVRGGCASCHTEDSFAAAADDFEHARSGFELTGAHARAECASCHPAVASPPEGARPFARASEVFPGPKDDCSTCHADPHGGAFRNATSELARESGGCARCHTTESFHDLANPFDHLAWTGYPLSPEHAELACVACHVPKERVARYLGGDPAVGISTHGPVAGRSCEDCHLDPHAGQFEDSPRGSDCARCHLDEGGLGFDHDRDSRFALDETHAKLSCDACHLPWPMADGSQVVRYRPLGTTCEACHGPVGRGRGEGGGR